jgi:hypothetical protein
MAHVQKKSDPTQVRRVTTELAERYVAKGDWVIVNKRTFQEMKKKQRQADLG